MSVSLLAILGIAGFCCIVIVAGAIFFMGDGGSVVDYDYPEEAVATAETSFGEGDEGDLPVEEPTAPSEEISDGGEVPEVEKASLYQHPSGSFSILPVGDDYEESDNYVTFYSDAEIVDVTVFNLG